MSERLCGKAGICAASLALLFAAGPAQACPGDCGGNGAVVVSDLVTGVRIALQQSDLAECRALVRS